MLFPYIYVPHKMEKMQEYIDFIFHEVWCLASNKGEFKLGLFDGKHDLKELMTAFHYSDTKGAEFFLGHVQRIYEGFAALDAEKIARMEAWYRGNNDLERICARDAEVAIVRYSEMKQDFGGLVDEIATFFKGLYAPSLLGLAPVRDKIGDIDDHYQSFVRINKEGKCPFCGISDLSGEYHTKREAYDHYLPKALYPFNSINFRNLVPACSTCNSGYKSSKDPALVPKDPAGGARRRAMFFPFGSRDYAIEIALVLRHADIETLTPDDLSIQFGPAELLEPIDTWRDVYGVEERYKAKCLAMNDGKYWIEQLLDEAKNYGEGAVEALNLRERLAGTRPYADCNFLRAPFLRACMVAGLF